VPFSSGDKGLITNLYRFNTGKIFEDQL